MTITDFPVPAVPHLPTAHPRLASSRPPASTPVAAPAEPAGESRSVTAGHHVLGVARVGLGFTFLWAFADKLVGLDHSTPAAKAWLNGGSPATGFLKGVAGPFAGVFNGLAGNTAIDVLFMAGLLGIGLALTVGIGMRIAAASSSVLLVLMWMASLPIKTNPFLDDHLIYALVIVGLALTHAGDRLGLGGWWSRTALVRRFPILR